MADDLTIIYLTLNRMPDRWVAFQLDHLYKAVGNAPIIAISRSPMSPFRYGFRENLLQTEPPSYWNVYMQLLRGAERATTPFVGLAEDDTLYTWEHFHEFRPPMDAVSYDRSRWSLFAWEPNPIYCLRQRVGNCSLIAPRDYLIDALRERKARWGDQVPPNEITGEVGRPIVDRRLRVAPRKAVEWYSTNPIVQLNHLTGMDVGRIVRADGRVMHKQHGQIKAVEIPHWGRAADVVKMYEG